MVSAAIIINDVIAKIAVVMLNFDMTLDHDACLVRASVGVV